MDHMDPGRREAALAMADALPDNPSRRGVLAGYTDDGYHREADYAAVAWACLIEAEDIVLRGRPPRGFDSTYRDGREI